MLTEETYRWIISHIDGKCDVVRSSQLRGGMSSHMYALILQTNTQIDEIVLRQIDNPTWLKEEPNLIIHEAMALQTAEVLSVNTPKVIAYDEIGERAGLPTLMMSKLPGEPQLIHQNKNLFLQQLAYVLSCIHQNNVTSFPYKYDPYHHIEEIRVPKWSKHPSEWRDLLNYRSRKAPKDTYRLIHRDFHPNNVLFKEGKITGVVDWINACIGPIGVDVGHCRWNLAMIYGVKMADKFLDLYQAYHPEFHYNMYWDIVTLFDVLSDPVEVYKGWEIFGLTDITNKLLEERMDTYMLSIWRRIFVPL